MIDLQKNMFFYISEILRKDEGIKGASQAVEQISWMLLLKKTEDLVLNYEKKSAVTIIPYDMLWSRMIEKFQLDFQYDEKLFMDFIRFKIIPFYAQIRRVESEGRIGELLKHISIVFKHVSCRMVSARTFYNVANKIQSIDLYDEKVSEQFEQLVSSMVDNAAQSGAFYTPRVLAIVMLRTLSPNKFSRFYDPTVGTCGFLLEAMNEANKNLNEFNSYPLFTGVEINPTAYLLGLVNVILSGGFNYKIIFGNSLEREEVKSQKFDLILSNPPFGQSIQNSYEPTNLNKPRQLEALFLEHVLDRLDTGGKAAIIVPEILLHNTGKPVIKLRKRLLENYRLDTVVSLPTGAMAPFSSVKLCILFIENTSPKECFWLYDFGSNERFTKRHRLTLQHFNDFLSNLDNKEKSENFFPIRLLDINNDYEIPSSHLSVSQSQPKALENIALDLMEDLNAVKVKLQRVEALTRDIDKLSVSSISKCRTVRIEKVFKFNSGKPLSKKDMSNSGDFPVYGGNGVIGSHDDYNLTGKNLLVGKVGSMCGNVHYVEENIWMTNNAFRIEVFDETEVHLPYLAKAIEAMDLRQHARGTAQIFITYNRIKGVKFKLPPIDIQIKLATMFAELDVLISKLQRNNERQSDDLESLKNNLKKSMSFK